MSNNKINDRLNITPSIIHCNNLLEDYNINNNNNNNNNNNSFTTTLKSINIGDVKDSQSNSNNYLES